MRRALLSLALAIAGIGLFTGGAAWLLTDPRPPAGASRGERLYYAYCVECHGRDGRGSWRAALFLLRPGDLADPEAARQPDRYLFDLIKHGGSPIGRPGMPAFSFHMRDEDILEVVQYLRTLPRRSGALLDPDEEQVVAARPDGQADPVARLDVERGALLGRHGDRHRLHGAHPERGDGFVADEEEVGRRAGDHLALNLVRGRPQDGAPQAGRERRDQHDEDDDQQPAGAGR